MTAYAFHSATEHHGLPRDRVLIVEDERVNLSLLTAHFSDAGYEVDTAGNGQEALQKLRGSGGFMLIVTDRLMPVMDGMELFRAIRADAKLRHIPVIMQTGANAPQEISEGIKAGVYYYLTKPYQESALLALASAAIRDSRQQAQFLKRLQEHDQAMHCFMNGTFHIRTPEQAEDIAFLLSTMFARPDLAVSGLYELILNGIEHGNLGIGMEQKSRLLVENRWRQEIEARLALPEHRQKKVTVTFSRSETMVTVTIGDDGNGFDWRPYLEIEPSRATQSNGRGIAKANLLSFDTHTYQDKGNRVQVTGKAAP